MAVTLDVLWCLLMVHLAASLWTDSRSFYIGLSVWVPYNCGGVLELWADQCLVRSVFDGRGSYAVVSVH